MKNTKRLVVTLALVFGGLFVLVLGTLIIVALFVLPPMVKERIVDEARARGIELGFDDVEVSWSHLTVEQARFRLVGVRGVAGTVDRIDITTSGFEPTGVNLEKLHVELLGSLPSVALELSEWTKNYPKAYALPLRAEPVSLAWRTGEKEDPWLVITNGTVGKNADGGQFVADKAQVTGLSLGPVGTSWSKTQGKVQLGLGEPDPKRAPVSIDVEFDKEKPTAHVELQPTKAEKLAGPLGIDLPVSGVTVSSEVELEFRDKQGNGPVDGTMHVKLDGYVPPHPREIDGFVFGKATEFSSKFTVSEDKEKVELSDSRVRAGAFQLKGKGEAQRYRDHARIRLEFTGFLGCAALAGAAAETHLGQVLSKLPKLIAKQTLQGTVGVTVKIDADTRDLAGATVLRQIGIGCGLKPLAPPTPEELEAFARELPEFVGELPSLAGKLAIPALGPVPSGFAPPKLNLPKIEIKRGSATQAPKDSGKPLEGDNP